MTSQMIKITLVYKDGYSRNYNVYLNAVSTAIEKELLGTKDFENVSNIILTPMR